MLHDRERGPDKAKPYVKGWGTCDRNSRVLPVIRTDTVALSRELLFWGKPRIVAIPVCNEDEHIVPCLLALATQKHLPHRVVLWINNTPDETENRAHSLIPSLPFELETVTVCYPPAMASAGKARRDAMAHAAKTASPDAILLTTDADSEVASDWMDSILEAFIQYPVEAVFGRVLLLPEEYKKIPPHLHEDEKLERAYGAILDQIELLLSPEPHDPWPRHLEHSGASIAVTHAAWRRTGGIPNVPSGEDRAFARILRQNGIAARHAPQVQVYVSARLQGRARGGMAETLTRRLIAQDEYIDDAFEPVSRRLLRLRRERTYWQSQSSCLDISYPDLPVVCIRRNDLQQHHERALRVLKRLRQMKQCLPKRFPIETAGQYDIPFPALTAPESSVFPDRP